MILSLFLFSNLSVHPSPPAILSNLTFSICLFLCYFFFLPFCLTVCFSLLYLFFSPSYLIVSYAFKTVSLALRTSLYIFLSSFIFLSHCLYYLSFCLLSFLSLCLAVSLTFLSSLPHSRSLPSTFSLSLFPPSSFLSLLTNLYHFLKFHLTIFSSSLSLSLSLNFSLFLPSLLSKSLPRHSVIIGFLSSCVSQYLSFQHIVFFSDFRVSCFPYSLPHCLIFSSLYRRPTLPLYSLYCLFYLSFFIHPPFSLPINMSLCFFLISLFTYNSLLYLFIVISLLPYIFLPILLIPLSHCHFVLSFRYHVSLSDFLFFPSILFCRFFSVHSSLFLITLS